MTQPKLPLLGGTLLALAGCGEPHAVQAASAGGALAEAVESTQSVVIFLVDTLRADHLGVYGYERDTSPNIDALAVEGVVFENCLAQSSWTKPATASVLTGEHPARHGATNPQTRLSDGVRTLAERVSAAGVNTAALIANGFVSEEMGFARGFDEFPNRNGWGCDLLIDEALEWIEAQGNDPFLLYVHTVEPHHPYQPPAPFDRAFDPDYDGAVTGAESKQERQRMAEADLKHVIALYDGEIAYTDQEFGRFVRALSALGREDDTAVIFLSDHGEAFGEHDEWGHNPLLHREVIEVPLILRVPGAPSLKGTRCEELVSQVDVAPTVLRLLGVPGAEELPGTDLLERATRRSAGAQPVYGISEVDFYRHRKAVVGGGMKYIREYSPVEQELLFDLREDPDELQDLLPAGRPVADRYAAILDGFVRATNTRFSLLVQNGDVERRGVLCVLATPDAALSDVRLVNGEWSKVEGGNSDGPIARREVQVGDVIYHATLIQLMLEPRDFDGVEFQPPPDGEVLAALWMGDGWAPPERFLLGAGTPAEGSPVWFSAGAGDLATAPFPPGEDLGDDPYRIRIWRNLTAQTEDGEISQETYESLRAMGYFGDDEQ